jgi:Kelch motif/Galactose oxidase, central domain
MHVLDIAHINNNNRHRRHNNTTNNCGSNPHDDIDDRSFDNNDDNDDGNYDNDDNNNNNCQQILQWYQPAMKGTPPGACNMHSADYVTNRKEVYVFRGGNGREYLNDLHALHVDTLTWRKVQCSGTIPQQRANHSSAILDKIPGGSKTIGSELFIFGGWNGTERLNDIHILDTDTSTWTAPHVAGVRCTTFFQLLCKQKIGFCVVFS